MDLLLDVNIILDLCTPRLQWYDQAKKAVDRCRKLGGSLWLYAGSVQTLEYTLRQALTEKAQAENRPLTRRQIALIARLTLSEFVRDKNYLAALSSEGNVFDTDDPEDEQLVRALSRFAAGSIKLLTRDQRLLESNPDQTISPEDFSRLPASPSQINFIDLKAQQESIRPQLEKNIHTVLQHGRYILGPEVKELEEKLADFVGVNHCIGVSSGTDALLMCLMAQNIGPGDAIFTTPFTFIATAEVISLLGATPVFVDIDARTFNLDPEKLKLAISAIQQKNNSIYPLPRDDAGTPLPLTPKGIIPVDLFGLPADYDSIMAIAHEHSLFVLEDAAQGLGGVYKGKPAGGLGHMGITSFFPAKPLGCYGDGGAIFTDDEHLADLVRSIRVHGKGTHKYDNIRIGVNARLHTMQAAILLSKLQIFPDEIKKRQQVAKQYTEGLKDTSLSTPFVPDDLQSVWAQYSLVCDDREPIQNYLKTLGIPTAVYYGKSLHLQPAYHSLHYKTGNMPNSERISQHVFSLPMHPYLTSGEIERIVQAVSDVVG
jgi:UDP-2-acetamido-2-deoxy-ribo-hexuluronate aminotransferase